MKPVRRQNPSIHHLPARRHALRLGALALLLGSQQLARAASTNIVAVRVWPAQDYTRVTIESDQALRTRHHFVDNPPRLAVDIEDMQLKPALQELVGKVRPDDPYIAAIRMGQNSPKVLRLVLDLKQAVRPQVFTLAPVATYRHRLVFDLYPRQEADPLLALIQERLGEMPYAQTAPPAAPTDGPDDPLGAWIARREDAAAAPAPPGKTPKAPPTKKPPAAGKTDRIIVVALDPGHGGEDPGATGPKGTHEKDVALKIAQLLRQRINRTRINGNPMRAFLTRDADFYVPLHTRVQKARRVQADLFISIHADAFTTPKASGASVFALSTEGSSSNAARWLADKENQADQVGGINIATHNPHVRRAVLDMSTAMQVRNSLQLGSAVLGEIGSMAKLHKKHVERAGFVVLRAPDIPSVLVETAFISNPQEEARLRSPAYQKKLAEAIMRGIRSYFAKNPPLARSRVA